MVMQRTGLEFRRYSAAPENTTLILVSLNHMYIYIYPLFVSVLVSLGTGARTCPRAQSSQDLDPLTPLRCPRVRRLGYRHDSSLEQCASRPSPAKHSDHTMYSVCNVSDQL